MWQKTQNNNDLIKSLTPTRQNVILLLDMDLLCSNQDPQHAQGQ
jgi:hypothetical protein